MYKKLVKYDKWHFAEVDPVCLKRTAIKLRDQINEKIKKWNDPYSFYTHTMPVVEAAIRGEIVQSLNQNESKFISESFYHDRREGILPLEYDQKFATAVAEFSVTAEALSLEQTEEIIVDNVTYGWMIFEEKEDLPDIVKQP